MRVALYFTPPAEAELTRLAACWLGRDAFTGEATRDSDPGLDPLVAAPARYGFHATLKAPFRLTDGVRLADVERRLAGFCAEQEPIPLPELRVVQLGNFLALEPRRMPAELRGLEAIVVRRFDDLRAPLLPREVERRKPEEMSERQREYLHAWGYPYVLEEFRFHMTLTGPLPDGKAETLLPQLRERLGSALAHPLALDRLALFVEPEPGAPFLVHSQHPFRLDQRDS